MQVERVLEGEQGFTSELQPSINTNLLLKNDHIPRYMVDYERHLLHFIYTSYSELFPRNFLDTIQEIFIFQHTLENKAGFTEYNTVNIIDDPYGYIPKYGFWSSEYEVLDFYNGWLGDTITGGIGTERNISLVFALSDADLENTRTLFSQSVSIGTDRGYTIAMTDRKLFLRMYNNSGTLLLDEYLIDYQLETKKWYHLIVTHDSNTVRCYLDGLKICQFTFSGTCDINNAFKLGNMLNNSYHFKGLMRSLWIGRDFITDEQAFLFYKHFKEHIHLTEFYQDVGYDFYAYDTGTWSYFWEESAPKPGYITWSNTVNDTFTWVFEGENFDIYLFKESASSCTLNVYLDGSLYDTINTAGQPDGVYKAYSFLYLDAGEHEVVIELTSGTVEVFRGEVFILKNKKLVENIRYIEEDVDQTHFAWEKTFPRLLPRFELDGLDERKLLFYRYMDGTDEDFNSDKGAYIYGTTILTERKDQVDPTDNTLIFDMKVATFYSGGNFYTNNKPTSDGGSVRSLSVWFKAHPDDIDGVYHILVNQRVTSATNTGYYIAIRNTGYIYCLGYNSSNVITINLQGTTLIEANKWYNVILTHDASTCELYLNGSLENSGSMLAGDVDYTSQYFRFGVWYDTTTYQFNGQLAGFFIFSQHMSSFDVSDYYDTSKWYTRNFPEFATVEMSENSEIKMLDFSNHKDIFLNMGEYYKITFTGIRLTVYGSYGTNGGVGKALVRKSQNLNDFLYWESINCYSASPVYDVLCDFIADEFGTYTLEIYNTGLIEGSFICISECVFNSGNNELKDYSTFNNNCELFNFTDGYLFTYPGLNKYCLRFTDAGSSSGYIKLNPNIYLTLGDGTKYLFALWFRPSQRAVSYKQMALLDTYYNTETEPEDFISVGYFQDPVNTKDILTFYDSHCLNYNVDIPELQDNDWYFLAFTMDNTAQEIKVLLCQQSDNTVLLDSTQAFNISPYAYETEDLKPIWIGYDGGNFDPLEGDIDSVLFEGNTGRTIEEMKEYFYLSAPTNGGNFSEDGGNVNIDNDLKLRNYKDGVNTYYPDCQYISKIIKLKNSKFSGYGKLILTSEVNDFVSIYNIQTRTSSNAETNSPTWGAWTDLGNDSSIESTNLEYLQFRFYMSNKFNNQDCPSVSKIEILDIDANPFLKKAFSLPVIYDRDTNLKSAVVHNNITSFLIQELNGANYIEFSFPFTSDKRQYINLEGLIQVYNDMYTVRKIIDSRDKGVLVTHVYAEAGFYDLQYAPPVKEREFSIETPEILIKYILSNSGWELGETDIYSTRDFSIENNSNCLELLRNIQSIFGGDLIFDSKIKKVYLYENSGIDNGVIFTYKKNVEITREQDSFDYINRLYVYGNGGLNIANLNNGLDYIELSSNIPIIKSKTFTNEDLTSEEELYNFALYLADKYSQENIVYKIKAKYLETNDNNLPAYNIGDIVTVYDKELDITLQTRIVKMKYNILSPMDSELELSSKTRSLGDDITEFTKYINKFKKFNFKVLVSMMRNYISANKRFFGYIEKQFVSIYRVSAQTLTTGTIIIPPEIGQIDVLSTVDSYSPVVGSLRNNDNVRIIGEYGKFYKIQYYGINV